MGKFTFIGTWRMAYYGIEEATKKNWQTIGDFVVNAIASVEDYQYFKSVGYGGLPNERGEVELDAGYMDGKTKNVGSVMAVKGISNPVRIARALSRNTYNRFLAGQGAKEWALQNGFVSKKMETARALDAYKRKLTVINKNPEISPYDGHDTVCFLGTNSQEEVVAATSTSGLFMKKPGRVGDSPFPGSGFYADSEWGAAAATGLGEDISRGVLSYEVVQLLSRSLSAQQAADKALFTFVDKMKKNGQKIGSISIIATDKEGNWGVSTNCPFQFATLSEKYKKPLLYVADKHETKNETRFEKAKQNYWEEYIDSIKGPIKI